MLNRHHRIALDVLDDGYALAAVLALRALGLVLGLAASFPVLVLHVEL